MGRSKFPGKPLKHVNRTRVNVLPSPPAADSPSTGTNVRVDKVSIIIYQTPHRQIVNTEVGIYHSPTRDIYPDNCTNLPIQPPKFIYRRTLSLIPAKMTEQWRQRREGGGCVRARMPAGRSPPCRP